MNLPFLALNGLDYHFEVAGEGPALLLLHGFTGALVNWSPHLPHFARRYTTVAVDLPGHGQTGLPAHPARYGHAPVGADLVALMERLGFQRFSLMGYSMGGRLALAMALKYPQRLRALLLESASPGLQDARERAARRRQDEALARRIEREGVRRFVTGWEQLPLFASQRVLPAERRARLREQRLMNSAPGLAGSLRGAGTGVQPSYWPQLPQLCVPTLLLTGALDAKFCTIADGMVAANPSFQAQHIANAGHCTHLEQPQWFRQAVLDFLDRAGAT